MATKLLRKRALIAAKTETTPGTAISLANGDAAMNLYEAELNPSIEFAAREGQSGFAPLPGALGAYGGTCTFSCDVAGGVSTPLWASVLLPACGFVETSGVFALTSKPVGASGGHKTITLGRYVDGVLRLLRGCAGTVVFELAAGQIARANFTFTGLWAGVSDAALLAPTYPTQKRHRFANAGLTLGSFTAATAPELSTLSIDLGNDVQLIESQEDVSGYCYAVITGRTVTGSMDPAATLVATRDLAGAWLAGTEYALSFTLGAGSGEQVAFSLPKIQQRNHQEGDRKGVLIETIEWQANRNNSSDDALEIDFTNA